MTEATLYSGYGATYVVDLGGDKIMPGAFKSTLPSFLRRGLLCWSHDMSRPVGMIRSASEDGVGLRIWFQFHSHPDGEAARTFMTERMAAKLDTGLSIGYRERRAEAGPGGTRRLLEVDLLEVSIVGLPMNTEANVIRPKGVVLGRPVPLGKQPRSDDVALQVAVGTARRLGVRIP